MAVADIAAIRAALERGDWDEAEELALDVLAVDPEDALMRAYLGSILLQKGETEDALSQFRLAVEAQPGIAAFHNELGTALAYAGDLTGAKAVLRTAAELSPDLPEIQNNLGNVERSSGAYPSAVACYRRALELRPDYPEAWTNLGVVLQETDDLEGARDAYERAIAIDPKNAFALTHLGVVLATAGDLSGAEALHRAAIESDPAIAAAHSNLAIVLKDQGQLAAARTAYERAMALDDGDPGIHSNALMARCYEIDIDERTLYAAHLAFGERYETSIVTAPPAAPRQEGPLRIGYVSADLYSHSVASFIAPVLERHDRGGFHVTCYSDVVGGDKVTAGLRAAADAWRDTARLGDPALLSQIQADAIDILVDLGGHTAGNRLAVFAQRAAPLQLSWIGYPATTGLSRMDYRLTDRWADPPGEADRWHSETLLRLEGGFLCYQAPDDAPAPSTERNRDAVTFGSFNNLSKINEPVIDAWAAILRAVPDARLLLKSRQLADDGVRGRLIAAFGSRAVDAGRLDLRARIASRAEHLALYHEIDIALDTFPYNGTTTTCEALWMGVPVVALSGTRHAGRVGASLLARAGWEAWIADSPERYVAIASALARGRPEPAQVRTQFGASQVMDAARFTKSLEEDLRRIWRLRRETAE
jgi:protein O-GlcNAc transferase